MKFDLLRVMEHFAVVEGVLYRKLATGHLKPITLVDRGRLAVKLEGERLFGPEIAYACTYGVVPMFPIVQLDGNPLNCREDNLYPARLARLRYRVVAKPGGFKHPRSPALFRTEYEAWQDWYTSARAYYNADKAYVRQLEDQMRVPVPALVVNTTPRKVPAPRKEARSRPPAVLGRVWHWWRGEWLSLPLPVHASDDWMVRAAVVSEHPDARFVYDEVAGRTVVVL